jgi:hypothetical protein
VPSKDDDLDLEHAEFEESSTKGSANPATSEAQKDEPDAGSQPEKNASDSALVNEPDACASCGRRIVDRYFELNGRSLCPRCAEVIRLQHEQGAPGATARAVAFGVGGGVLGAALYYGVMLIADAEFGIIAIVVGILVGKGVRRGAGLHRHWLYPALGIGLTYLAITSTYIPDVMRALAADPAGAEVPAATPPLDAETLLGAWLFALFVPALMLAEFQIWGPIILAIGLWEGWRYGKSPVLDFRGPLSPGRATEVPSSAP